MFEGLAFQGQWRDYQARVLQEMDAGLADGRLHIVAAPGSGKTVLGWEAVLRLGRPALILSPSLTVRDQWADRLAMFSGEDVDHLLGVDIDADAPAILTTYQALHRIWADRDSGRFDALIKRLSAKSPITLVVDEAHHLRREWWNALFALTDALDEAKLIALTATPPYDVPNAEWSRYERLCGPIDHEISVPELVRNGDLCPHQDLLHLSHVESDVFERLAQRRGMALRLAEALKQDGQFIDQLSRHAWLTTPDDHLDPIYGDPAFLSALLIFLFDAGYSLPERPLELLGTGEEEFPPLDIDWFERLLQGLLFDHRAISPLDAEVDKALRSSLHKAALIRNGKVRLELPRDAISALAASSAKLAGIAQIAARERAILGGQLRMVILADHVRAADLTKSAAQPYEASKLGVVPIFETLRRHAAIGDDLAVLTGRLVIIPATCEASARSMAAELTGCDGDVISMRALGGDSRFCRLEAGSGKRNLLVSLVTRLFAAGHLHIIVGTTALLGEGWDAPSINSLVLASNSASFMATNQLRGRAIRIAKDDPGKVATIWHLATLASQAPPLSPQQAPNGEWPVLERRFSMFEGVSADDRAQIESGIERLAFDRSLWLDGLNQQMLERVNNRALTAARWQQSLGNSSPRSHVRRVAEPQYAPKPMTITQTLQWLIVSGIAGGLASAFAALRGIGDGPTITDILFWLSLLTFLYSLPRILLAALLWMRNGTVERSLWQVGRALLESLHHAGHLSKEAGQYGLTVLLGPRGRHQVSIGNATRREEQIFLDSLAELLGPIENPRYLLVRQSSLFGRIRTDYHAVPSLLSRKKEWAEDFATRWRTRLGMSHLLFTRSAEGRRKLLRARWRSFSGGFNRDVTRRMMWM